MGNDLVINNNGNATIILIIITMTVSMSMMLTRMIVSKVVDFSRDNEEYSMNYAINNYYHEDNDMIVMIHLLKFYNIYREVDGWRLGESAVTVQVGTTDTRHQTPDMKLRVWKGHMKAPIYSRP